MGGELPLVGPAGLDVYRSSSGSAIMHLFSAGEQAWKGSISVDSSCSVFFAGGERALRDPVIGASSISASARLSSERVPSAGPALAPAVGGACGASWAG